MSDKAPCEQSNCIASIFLLRRGMGCLHDIQPGSDVNTRSFSSIINTTEATVSPSRSVPALLPKRELTSLTTDQKYHVVAIKLISTRFGQRKVVDLEHVRDCRQTLYKQFFVYLPKRWAEVFTEEQLRVVQLCKLSLKVTGRTLLQIERVSVQLVLEYVTIKIAFCSNNFE